MCRYTSLATDIVKKNMYNTNMHCRSLHLCVCVVSTFTLVCAAISHHGNVLSCLFEFIFDTASDVSKIRHRELFKLDWSQNAGVGLEHLQSLDNTHATEDNI